MMENKYLPFIMSLLIMVIIGCNRPVKVLTVVGGHAFDTVEFFRMMGSLEAIQVDTAWHPGALDLLGSAEADNYDVLVFYDFIPGMPVETARVFNELTRRGKPMLFLHHALGTCQQWDGYMDMVGGRYVMKDFEPDSLLHSDFKHDIELDIKVEDPDHPVTSGVSDFTIHDEGYSNIQVSEDVQILLTTQHPHCHPLVGWVNQADNATCVYLMLGHDRHAYENEAFQKLVGNSIHWLSQQKP
jgi:type 1 glutamine amidotransferase